MFAHCSHFVALCVILSVLLIFEVHGFKCKRAFKDESKAETDIFGTLCPENSNSLQQCYFLNCSSGDRIHTVWGCAVDAKAVQKCSGLAFESDGYKCQCLVGKEGVEMSNEHMTNLDPKATATYTPSTPTTTSAHLVLSTQTAKLDETTLSSFAYRRNSNLEALVKAILLVFAIMRAVPVGVHISAL
uniref:EGF-like domain-containing protein n=1 Tax=Globodera pallida TaxID=36090 RepID=A0A183CHT0_GLOPA